jgi:outer membrane protein TolC
MMIFRTIAAAVIGLGLAGSAGASELTDLLQGTLDNPGLAAREMQSQAANTEANATNLRYFGQANVFAGQYRYDAARVVGIFTPGVTPLPAPVSQDISQYGVNYHLPVDVFGVIGAERAQGQASKATAQLLLRQETLLRLHQTLSAYVRLQALAVQAQALKLEQNQLEVYAKRVREEVRLGRTARLDLSLVQSDLARLAAQQATFTGNQRAALAALQASAGAAHPQVSAAIVVPPLTDAEDAQNSLPVALAQQQQASAEAAAQKVRRGLFPALSVDSQYTQYQGAGVQPHAWVVGLNVNLPLDPVSMKNADASAQRAKAAQSQLKAAQADTQAQIASLAANYQAANGNADALATEVAHRQEVVAVEREKWQLGASTMDALLYQERNLLDVQYALADARAQAATAWSAMQVLLGTPTASYIHTLEIMP